MGARSAALVVGWPMVVGVVAGCSSGGADQNSSSGRAAGVAAPAEKVAPAPIAKPLDAFGAPTSQAGAIPDTKAEVKTATMTVRVANVARAAQRAEDLTAAAMGTVAAAETTVDPDHSGRTTARLTLRVPNADFTGFLRSLAALGTRLDENQSTVDVTSQVVDVESRLATQRESVARVRALLSRANTIGDVVKVEGELSRREADLESLEAQQKALADKTAQATVTVTFVGEKAPAKNAQGDQDKLGFLVGLGKGWDAFAGAALVTVTVLGALLPFLILGAVLAVAAVLIWRTRLRRPPTTSATDSATPAT